MSLTLAHAAGGEPFVDLELHRLALALHPAAFFGQVGQAAGELAAQLSELVEQMVPVLQHTLGALAEIAHGVGQRRARTVAVDLP